MREQSLRVLRADDPHERGRWVEHWEAWPAREVHAHPGYASLFADEDSRPLAAVFRSPAGAVLYPFVLRDIASASPGALTDITAPYGYGGAFAWDVSDRSALRDEFWSAFTQWAKHHGVVSEFVRLSLFEDELLPYPGTVTVKQENIVVDLTLDPVELWMSFDHKVRKNVNKARRSGVSVEVDTTGARFEDFDRIYRETMDRRRAGRDYYFGRRFFDAIHRDLPGQFAYFHALRDGAVVSTELVLLSQNSAYSFLGGTTEAAFAWRPNDVLKFEIMRWCAEHGRQRFVLGGGYEPDDGIFRYKRAFAPGGVRPFAVGTRVLDESSYQSLSADRVLERGATLRDGFFPAYRA